jgi:prepilin-type N-terminal cleavage/methylation domain-containing protein
MRYFPRKGFTLIETIVVLVIGVCTLMALVNLFFMFNNVYGYQQAFIATAGSASTVLNSLETYVAQAEQVLSSRTISGTTYTTGASTLVLQLPAIDSSGSVIANAKDYVVFYASSTKLYARVSPDASSVRTGGTKQLSGTLQSITFTYDSGTVTEATSVSIDVQTRSQYKTTPVQSRLTETIYLRNRSPL